MPEFRAVDGVNRFLISITGHDDLFEMLTRLQSDSGLKAIKRLTVPLSSIHDPQAAHVALKIIEALTVISRACTRIRLNTMKNRVALALFECPDLLQLLAIHVSTHGSGPLANQGHVNAFGWTLVSMATALEDATRSHELQQGSSAVPFKIMTDIVCEHQLPVSLLLKRVLGLGDWLPVSIESDLVSALALKPFRPPWLS
jgi:hypothetical protein